MEKRRLKVYEKGISGRLTTRCVPEMKLSGDWLRELGFKQGDYVEVHTARELIVIRRIRGVEKKEG